MHNKELSTRSHTNIFKILISLQPEVVIRIKSVK